MERFDYPRMAKAAFSAADWSVITAVPALKTAIGQMDSTVRLDRFIQDATSFLIRHYAAPAAQPAEDKFQKIVRFAFSSDEWALIGANSALAAEAEQINSLDKADSYIRRATDFLFRQDASAALNAARVRSATILLRPMLLPMGV